MKIEPVNVVSCIPGKCDEPCPMSGTDVCCRDCGSPAHQKQIADFVESPQLVTALVNTLKTERKCKCACDIIAST